MVLYEKRRNISEKPLNERTGRAYELGAVQTGETPTDKAPEGKWPQVGFMGKPAISQQEALAQLRKREMEQYRHSHPTHEMPRGDFVKKKGEK